MLPVTKLFSQDTAHQEGADSYSEKSSHVATGD